MHKRYRQVLLPCDATSARYHNEVVASGESILELYDKLYRSISWDMLWNVQDSRKGTSMTREEFFKLVNRLNGWEDSRDS